MRHARSIGELLIYLAMLGQGAFLPVAWKERFGVWTLVALLVVPVFLLKIPRGFLPERPVSTRLTVGAAWHLSLTVLALYWMTQTPWDPWMFPFLVLLAPGAVITSAILIIRYRESQSAAHSMEPSHMEMKEPSNEPIE